MQNRQWRKSSRSGPTGGNCVEVCFENGKILVRDSKDKNPNNMLSFSKDEWDAFVGGAKDGEFDL